MTDRHPTLRRLPGAGTFGTPASEPPLTGTELHDLVTYARQSVPFDDRPGDLEVIPGAMKLVDVWEGHDYIGTYRLSDDDVQTLQEAEFTVRPSEPFRPATPRPGGLVRAIFDAASGKAPF